MQAVQDAAHAEIAVRDPQIPRLRLALHMLY